MKCIVIGAGPDIREQNHLKKLAKSKFQGSVIVTDVMLKDALEAGVTPEKFPDYYVISIEDMSNLSAFYDYEIIKKHAKNIKAILITISPAVERVLASFGFQMVTIDHEFGERELQNVGSCAWYYAMYKLNADEIILIGMNQGYPEQAFKDIDPEYRNLFLKYGHNPDTGANFVLDPVYTYYSSTLKEYISQAPRPTINCTVNTSIFGDNIISVKLEDYLG